MRYGVRTRPGAHRTLSLSVHDVTRCGLFSSEMKFGHTRHSRADLGGDSRVTSHLPPLERQTISCYYYACDLSCFDVVLCPSASQILPTPLHHCTTARVPKVTPSKKILDPPMPLPFRSMHFYMKCVCDGRRDARSLETKVKMCAYPSALGSENVIVKTQLAKKFCVPQENVSYCCSLDVVEF